MRILIVEDDADLAVAMSDYLELQGAECDFAYHGESGLMLVQKYRFDVIILDLMLPRINGVDVCEQLRLQGVSTPVLMLTACDDNSEQLRGFQAGIDDYVIKPSPMPLIWARVQALCRRNNPQIDKLTVDTLTCYFKEQRATREEKEIKLTPTGWKILSLLMRRNPEVVSRNEIEEYAWPDGDVERGNLNVQLHQLRKSVDKPFEYPLIHTLVGRGLCVRKNPEQADG
jgi:DNA-binding response OmpR family regulator